MRSWHIAPIVLAVVLIASPALALVEKSGNINCGGNYVAVTSLGLSNIKHYAPDGTLIGSWYNAVWTHRNSATFLSSTSWRVTSDGALSNPETYAYCWGAFG